MKINFHLNFSYFYIKILERDGFKIFYLLDDLDLNNTNFDIDSVKNEKKYEIDSENNYEFIISKKNDNMVDNFYNDFFTSY